MEVPGTRRRHRPALRPLRQAAGDGRLGARASGRGRPCAAATGSSAAAARRRRLRRRSRALTAIEALQAQGVPHARCVVLIEACEESGSPDLPAYVEKLADRIGSPTSSSASTRAAATTTSSGRTTSLRGVVDGDAHGGGAERGRALRRGQRHRALELPHRCASCSTGSRTSATGRDPGRELPRRDPARRASRRRARSRACSASDVGEALPVRAGHAPDDERSRRGAAQQHLAAGARRSPASTACPRWPTPATCCGRRPRSSSRCACRPPLDAARAGAAARRSCSRPIRPTAPA